MRAWLAGPVAGDRRVVGFVFRGRGYLRAAGNSRRPTGGRVPY